MKYSKTKKGFSLAEAAILLMISVLVVLASMPIITRKHYRLPERVPHGKWACKLINGVKHSATAANINAKLPEDGKWVEGCAFPKLPSNVQYLVVQTVGGGAAGEKGDVVTTYSNETHTIFTENSTDGAEYKVQDTGEYEIYFAGAKSGTANLYNIDTGKLISYIKVKIWGVIKYNCKYDPVGPLAKVPYIKFKYNLQHGDVLKLKQVAASPANNFNGQGTPSLCIPNTVEVPVYDDHGNYMFDDRYTFANIGQHVAQNGPTRTLILERGGQETELVTIYGSGGGYYVSSDSECVVADCKFRFTSYRDRQDWEMEDYVKPAAHITDYQTNLSSETNSKITTTKPIYNYEGGCGGDSGQANSILIEVPDKEDIPIEIGTGGVYGVNNGYGEKTRFDYVTAYGGMGCRANGADMHKTVNGEDGAAAHTGADSDSAGGAGGTGSKKRPVPPDSQLNGKDGSGLGAGGGGGGIAFNIDGNLDDYLNSSSINQLQNAKVIGTPGNGSSGGIIVSW